MRNVFIATKESSSFLAPTPICNRSYSLVCFLLSQRSNKIPSFHSIAVAVLINYFAASVETYNIRGSQLEARRFCGFKVKSPRVPRNSLAEWQTRLLTRAVISLYFPGFPEQPWPGQKDKVQRYVCPRCCSSFSKKANMLTHFRYECGKEPRFQCPYCGKRDRKSSNTYRHIRTYHKDSRIQAYKLY